MTSNAMKTVVATLGVLVVLGMAGSANAVKVTNMTTGTTLFEDGYENPPGGGNSNPLTGTWINQRGASMMATDAASPGPSEGAQYGSAAPGPETKNMATFDSVQSTVGDVIRVEWMSYVDPSPGAAEFFVSHGLWSVNDGTEGSPGGAASVVDFGMDLAGTPDTLNYYDGGWNQFTPDLNIIYNEWVPVTLDYAVGAATFDITYGGVTATGGAKDLSVTGGVIGQFQVGHGRGSINYVDAVPEPSTCALALIGLLTAVGCYRRRR